MSAGGEKGGGEEGGGEERGREGGREAGTEPWRARLLQFFNTSSILNIESFHT